MDESDEEGIFDENSDKESKYSHGKSPSKLKNSVKILKF